MKLLSKSFTLVNLFVIALLGSSFGFANVDSCANVYQGNTGKIRSELLSSLIAQIDGVSWSLSYWTRSSAQDKLWQDIYKALNEPSDKAAELSLEETRQLAWTVLSSPRRIRSLRTDSLDVMILETYFTKLFWHGHSTASSYRDSHGQAKVHSAMSNTNYKDWLMLLEKSGLKNTRTFTRYVIEPTGNFVSKLTDIIKENPTLTDNEVTQFVELLQLSIESGKKTVAENYDGHSFSGGYTPESLTYNLTSLIKVDKVRKNQRFQSLMQKLTSYLELYGYAKLADELREAMNK